MKTLVCQKPGIITLEEREKPQSAPDGWALVDLTHIGVCGTDFHIFEGLHPFLEYPRVMGHELGGVLASSVGKFNKGDTVIINPYIACGKCRACKKSKPNCCYNIKVLGVHTDGGMCERVAVPVENLYSAEGLSPKQASMVEFMAIGAHAVRRAEIENNARVLVTGVGPIGLGVALFARLQGAEVSLLDFSQDRLDLAKEKFGFTSHFNGKSSADDILAATDDDGYDVVFDATGNKTAMENGFQFVAHGGTYVLVSVVHGDITFADPEFHKREMRLVGSRNATREDFDRVVKAFLSGDIDANQLNTHTAKINEFPELIEGWVKSRDTMIKAIVEI